MVFGCSIHGAIYPPPRIPNTIISIVHPHTNSCSLFNNTVGGIYTVIRTKAASTVEELGDHYILLGPLNEVCMRTEVDVTEPTNPALKRTITAMRQHDIKVGCVLPSISRPRLYQQLSNSIPFNGTDDFTIISDETSAGPVFSSTTSNTKHGIS